MPIEIHTAYVGRRDRVGGYAEAVGYVLDGGEKVDCVTLVGDTPELAIYSVLEKIVLQRRQRCDEAPDRHVEHGKVSASAAKSYAF